MKVAVVGAGLIGSAAARHLALAGHEVILVGPSEPDQKAAHHGVFASHYDSGRISRALDRTHFWSRVSQESIARFGGIEQKSGIAFRMDTGALMVATGGSAQAREIAQVAADHQIIWNTFDADGLAKRFPYFAFSDDEVGFYEAKHAGMIDPRKCVAAQLECGRQLAVQRIEREAASVKTSTRGVDISVGTDVIAADRVLLTTGGFTSNLLQRDIGLTVYARTVALFEIGEAEVKRLAGCPSLVHWNKAGKDPYFLPAVRYPDGKLRMKIGGDPVDFTLEGAEIGDWFRSGGSQEVAGYLTQAMLDLMPGLKIDAITKDACVTSFTPNGRPILQQLDGQIYLAVGGCGAGAKCADELGRLGAQALLGHDLPDWVETYAV